MSRGFIALYSGWCPRCHYRIEEGEVVMYDDDKNIVHENCERDDFEED